MWAQVDVHVVQDKETKRVIKIFACDNELREWQKETDKDANSYRIISRRRSASVKKVLTTV